MFRRIVALCVVLGFASVAQAGAVLELEVSDMGSVDADGNRVGWAPLSGPVGPGDQFMVHAYLTTDMTLTSGARLIALDATGPATTIPYNWLGVDADTVNQPIDAVPNFWFDYTGTFFAGRFPAQGQVYVAPFGDFKTSGEYTDFSNTISGTPAGPGPVITTFGASTASTNMFFLEGGVPYHIGAMVVSVPGDYVPANPAGDALYLDLLNDTASDINWGARIDFDFTTPTTWSALGGEITYGQGGPATATVIPEPATLLLLGLGGVAVLRRRR